MKIKLHLLFFFVFTSILNAQFQVGQDIEGTALRQNLGRSLAINQSGNRIVVGSAPSTVDINPKLQVFDLINDTWTQVGQDITDPSGTINVGRYASINNFGNIIAVSDPISGTSQGTVRIFELIGSAWTQLGTDIIGASGENIGAAISLNGAGNLIIVGTLDDIARVYEYNPTTDNWEPYGQTLTSNSTSQFNNFQFGRTVDINDAGTKIVVGANLDDTNGVRAGQVTVYEFNFGTWTLMGSVINGNANDRIGAFVSMNDSGNNIAIGSPFFSGVLSNVGKTQIFEFNGTDWSQVGNDILGDDASGASGTSVSLSDDGTRVAIGEPFRDNGGRTIIYDLESNNWNSYFEITINQGNGRTGEVVALSGNGEYILESNPENSDNFIFNGEARVFFLGCDTETELPNVMTQNITVELDENGQVVITPEQIDNGSTDNCQITALSLSQDTFTCDDAFNSNNRAINFNGVDQHIAIADDASNDISGSYTLSCWVKYDASGPFLQRPISKPSALDGTGYCIAMNNNGAVGLTYIDASSGAPNGLGSADGVVLPDTWTHVAVTYNDTNNSAIVYVNGAIAASGSINPQFPNSAQPLFIGTEGLGTVALNARRFKGDIDEVRIWDIARTQSEIMTDMNQRIEPKSGLVGLYRFDEGIGTVVNDASSLAPNGNFVNLDETTDWVDGAPALSVLGENIVTLTATDGNNNSASATAIVTVEDNLPPVVVTQNIVVALSCDNINDVTIDVIQIDNGSTDNCSIASMSLDNNYFDISNLGDNTVTLTVTDTSGNSGSETAIVTVVNYNQTLYVNQNATGNDTGDSWINAFTDLQSAIDIASTCNSIQEIWVAKGTYKPSKIPRNSVPDTATNFFDDRNFSFHLVNNVSIYGGFGGYESNLSERNLVANPTILSGDIGIANDNSDNALNVIVSVNDSSNTVIDGFIIEDGNSDRLYPVILGNEPCDVEPCPPIEGGPDGAAKIEGQLVLFINGGAINAINSSLQIKNSIFRNNNSINLGIIYIEGGQDEFSQISNSLFYQNSGTESIVTTTTNFEKAAKLNNLTFYDNTLISSFGTTKTVFLNRLTEITNCVFYNNIASNDIDNSFPNPNRSNNFVTNINSGIGTLLTTDPFSNSIDIDGTDDILGTSDDGLFPASGSEIENSGVSTAETTLTDIFGNPRIVGASIDVGAYEHQLQAVDFTDNRIYVNQNATGNNTGESWTNAFTDLQSAIDKAREINSLRDIWIAAGTYRPSAIPINTNIDASGYQATPRDYTFQMVDGLSITGGFVGNETSRTQRSFSNTPTILSGDINNTQNDDSDDAYHVLISIGDNNTNTKIDGLEITNGNADNNTNYQINGTFIQNNQGAGINTNNSELDVFNTKIHNNFAATNGGGVYSTLSNSEYRNVHFINNSAARSGGGMQSSNNTNLIVNCLFDSNTAGVAGTSFIGGGGGLFNVGDINDSNRITRVINTVINNNVSNFSDGGALVQGRGNFRIQNCTITNNQSPNAIAVFSADAGTMLDNIFYNPGYTDVQTLQGQTFFGTSNLVSSPINFHTPPTQFGFTQISDNPFVDLNDADGADDIFGTEDDGLFPADNSSLINSIPRTFGVNTEPLDFAEQPRQSGIAIDVGAYEFQTVLTNTDFEMTSLSIYPNPTNQTLNIEGLKTSKKVEVFNISGQKLLTKTIDTNRNTINISQLPTGIYFLKINNQSIKFIKQ